ncbi:hypothetical protein [Nostoc sp.]|uniref:hypothetical protein n=1 Tax=Nostoc sp. TaxID=1180 RepID=UPI002FF86869
MTIVDIANNKKSGSTFRVVLDAAIAFTQSGEPFVKERISSGVLSHFQAKVLSFSEH